MIALTGLKADRDELDRLTEDCCDRFTRWALSKRLGSTQEDKLKAYPLNNVYKVQTRGQVNRSQERSVRSTISKMYSDWWNTCGCTERKWIKSVEQQVGRGVNGVRQNGHRRERDI